MTNSPIKFISAAISLLWLASAPLAAAMTEEHRLEEYHKRGYKWPLEKVVPDTPGWDRIMRRRFEQVARIEDSNARYNGWMAFMTSALLATNYTENGWGLTRAPEHITKRLQQRLHKTLVEMDIEEEHPNGTVTTKKKIPQGQGTRKEHYINVIGGDEDSRPIMIQDHKENDEILMEMKPMFEWWSGVDLEGSIAYGIRAYRNDSNLLMHVDKSSTHIISGIFHIDHSEDSEPWPIIIEDFQGNTNQVYMEAGDILFYESSKCFHGRPQTFIGSYYASLFMHYRPVGYPADKMQNEIHYSVPPHWSQQLPPVEGLDELEVVGTSFKEPNCKNLFCSVDESNENSKYLVNWHGPAPKGKIVTNGWDPVTMTPPEDMNDEFNGGNREITAAKRVLENGARAGSDEL